MPDVQMTEAVTSKQDLSSDRNSIGSHTEDAQGSPDTVGNEDIAKTEQSGDTGR